MKIAKKLKNSHFQSNDANETKNEEKKMKKMKEVPVIVTLEKIKKKTRVANNNDMVDLIHFTITTSQHWLVFLVY